MRFKVYRTEQAVYGPSILDPLQPPTGQIMRYTVVLHGMDKDRGGQITLYSSDPTDFAGVEPGIEVLISIGIP